MVRFTAKDIAAQHDPRRFRMLPPPQIAGTAFADSEALQSAYAHIDSVHRRQCSLRSTTLVVQRIPVLGVANDVNYIVRGLAIAMRERDPGQLLLLPPSRAPEGASAKWAGDRTALAAGRNMGNAWHWLDELPGSSHRTVFWPSACQDLFEGTEKARLEAFDMLSRNGSSMAVAAEHLGLASHVVDTALAIRVLAKGMTLEEVPERFRQYGVLWWWQALTTYLVRVREPLASRLQQHPALQVLVNQLDASTSSSGGHRRPALSVRTNTGVAQQLVWLKASRHALRRATGCTVGDLGWAPRAAFDAALHVRMGDACGPKARRHQAAVRKCVHSLQAAMAPLLAHGVVPSAGHLFLATDSPAIVHEAANMAATLPFEVHYLGINRSKYDTEAWIELASAAEHSKLRILEETMLDLLMLSRARYIAGSMYGNVPRLALQLRSTMPGDARRLAYITTDGRDWCTKPTCMANNTATGRYW